MRRNLYTKFHEKFSDPQQLRSALFEKKSDTLPTSDTRSPYSVLYTPVSHLVQEVSSDP